MRLDPLYRATFTTPEHWTVALAGDHGTEDHSFLIVEGRSDGRLAGRLRAANFPRRRTDGTLTPDFRGVIETDDGAVVLFTWHGYGLPPGDGPRQLVGSLTHLSDDARFRWLNDTVCTVAGEVREADTGGLRVLLEVAALVWEPVGDR
jgi:hypothetical protein